MNLLELMLDERVIFPAYAQYAVQDYTGRIKFSDKKPVCNEKYFAWEGCWCSPIICDRKRLDNWHSDIVTRDQYRDAGGSMEVDDDAAPSLSPADAATAKQSAPKGSGNPILGMVLADLTNRALEGTKKYGEPLKARNGRNPLWDAYQEALDLAMYLRQAIEEQK